MAKTSVIITLVMVQAFITDTKTIKNRNDFRTLFFNHFKPTYIVPIEFFHFFFKCSQKFYNPNSTGYNGIMQEIMKRIEIAERNEENLLISDFLKHIGTKTDLYDASIRKAYELKTGCGDWLISRSATTLDEVIEEYTRKTRLIKWSYHFKPDNNRMNGKKSVSEGNETGAERSNPKKVGYQYPIDIEIETTYRKLFQYMRLYPAGISTFFKESVRTEYDGYTTHIWQLQTIKNSKKKIAFFEHFNTWIETGLTLEEYNATQETDEE